MINEEQKAALRWKITFPKSGIGLAISIQADTIRLGTWDHNKVVLGQVKVLFGASHDDLPGLVETWEDHFTIRPTDKKVYIKKEMLKIKNNIFDLNKEIKANTQQEVVNEITLWFYDYKDKIG